MAISTVRALFNGTWYTLTLNSSTGLYEGTISAPSAPGNQMITVQATNANGIVTSAATTINIKWELVPPVVTITGPTEGGWYANARQPITFTLRDEAGGSGVDLPTMVFLLDGKTLTSTSPGMVCTAITNGYDCTYTPPSALAEGNHGVSIGVRDIAGNQSTTVSRSWNIDTVNPSLSVTYPPDNLITNKPAQTITGTVEDTGVGLASLTINGAAVAVSGNTFSCPMTFPEGTSTITVVATDKLGHTSSVTRSVLVDTTPPVFRWAHIFPNMDAVPLGETFVIRVVMADSFRPKSKETVTGMVNGIPATFTEGPELTWTAIVPRADNDTYDVYLTAQDEAGNSAEYIVYFPCGMESKWTWEPIDFLNFWDLNRIERNTDYVRRWLFEMGYNPKITTIKTDWTEPDIPTQSDIDRVRRNVDALQAALFQLKEWREITYNDGFDYEQVNAIEWDLHIMDQWLVVVANTFRVYSGQIYSGMWP